MLTPSNPSFLTGPRHRRDKPLIGCNTDRVALDGYRPALAAAFVANDKAKQMQAATQAAGVAAYAARQAAAAAPRKR